MDALLDTHALLWFVGGDDQMSTRAREIVEAPGSRIVVSAASAWEIATKYRLGKLDGAKLLAENFVDTVAGLGFDILPISAAAAQRAGLLPAEHRDPFDRVLAAQAFELALPIISADAAFDDLGVRRIW